MMSDARQPVPDAAIQRRPALDGRRPRRQYLDWLRGLAVLIMIEAHVIDSWTGGASRSTQAFGRSLVLGGFGAPLFLFLAGVAVALSAGSKLRKSGDIGAAGRAVQWRGLEIFGLAFLFRVQAWILGWAPPHTLLRVDILNIMGPCIALAAALWGSVRTFRRRVLAFAVTTVAISFLTPAIRAFSWLSVLPDPLEAYIRPVHGISNFVLFPWAAFVFAGALIGVVIDETRTGDEERRLNIGLVIAGVAIAVVAYILSFFPNPAFRSEFWTTSLSFFFIRAGIMTAGIGFAYAWQSSPGGLDRWSPLKQLGRTSLFIYWIHVEMVYGLVSLRLHQALTLTQAWIAWGIFSLFMLLCSLAKDRVVAWWTVRHDRPPQATPAALG
jgi:uncharacterized membrane protein